MALTRNEVVLVLNKLKIAYSNDVIDAFLTSDIDERSTSHVFKSAFSVAAQDNRRIVTANDVQKALAQTQIST